MYGRSSALDLCENQRLKVCVVVVVVGGGGGVESSFSEKLLSSKQAFQYQRKIKGKLECGSAQPSLFFTIIFTIFAQYLHNICMIFAQ